MAARPDINVESVCRIVLKARQFDAKEGMVEPQYGANAMDEGFRDILGPLKGDPVVEELTTFIHDLTEDEQCTLVALAWTGRGDFTASDWTEAFDLARQRHGEGDTAGYLLGMPLVADYLSEGLGAFGLSCVEE
jgi:hypothetical protein